MTDSPQQTQPRDRFNDIVVPTAKGLEKFFWNLAWFALLVHVALRRYMHFPPQPARRTP